MNTKNIFLIVLVFVVSIFSFSCKAKPTETPVLETKISGRVIDKETNAVIASALITTSPTTSSVSTDATGSYTIADVKTGQYVVSASKNGYKTNSINVIVVEGKTASADIQIETLKPELVLSTQNIDFGSNQLTASLIITNGSGINSVNWTASKSVDWLTLSQTSGAVSATAANTILITANRTGLTFGNYSTVVAITSNGGNKDVAVTMTVANPNAPQLTVTPVSLDFDSLKTQLSSSISNSGTGTLSWSVSGNQSWISLNPTSGTNTGTTSVTVSRTGLSPGSYSGTVSVTSNGGSTTVPLIMKVPIPALVPTLSVAQTSLDFDSLKTQLNLSVSNSGTGTLSWSVSGNQSWISLNPTSGTNTGTVIVTASRTGLSPGSYSGAISVTSNGGTKTVIVNCVVPRLIPKLSLSVDTLSFATSETQKTFNIYNAGSGTLNWSVSSNQTWLVVNPGSGSNQGTVTATIDRTGLQPGDYNATITINSDGGNGSIPVSMRVVPNWANFGTATGAFSGPNALCIISATDAWIVGSKLWHWNGTNWVETVKPAGLGILRAVNGNAANNVWAAGDGGSIIKWNGTSWSKQTSPTTENITDIISISANSIWVSFNHSINSFGGVFHSSDGASTWKSEDEAIRKLFSNTSVDMDFVDLDFSSSNNVWTVAIRQSDSYAFKYDGLGWTRIDGSGFSTSTYPATDVNLRVVSATSVWVANKRQFSAGGIAYYNGSSWITSSTIPMKAIDIISASIGVSGSDKIYSYDGSTWTAVTSTLSSQVSSVKMLSSVEGWALLVDGTILRYK